MGRRRDRDMTPDEEFEFSELLFRGAKRLGFPLVRIQSAKPDLLRRLLPVAEELELKLAYEIHAPMGPNAPEIVKVRDVYAELDSPLLGFVATSRPPCTRCRRRCCVRCGERDSTTRPSTGSRRSGPRMRRCGAPAGVHRLPPGSRLRPRPAWCLRAPRIQHARSCRPARVGRHHAADPPRAREVLRHRRRRPGARDRLPRTRARLRRGRVPRLLVERVGGSRVRRDREVDPLALVRRQHDLIRASMRSLA